MESNNADKRIAPVWIKELNPSDIFVFGSNRQGVHGKGAAKQALRWGAKRGHGLGMYGQTYAIPTRDYHGLNKFTTLPIEDIRHHINLFIEEAKRQRSLRFLVTEIGTGNAGYSHEQIAPLFEKALSVDNIYLPQKFVELLTQLTQK